MTALKEKYFGDAEVSAKDFQGWKPEEIHEVNAKTWESVDINGLPLILVIGIYRILNSQPDGGHFISTKLKGAVIWNPVTLSDVIHSFRQMCFFLPLGCIILKPQFYGIFIFSLFSLS